MFNNFLGKMVITIYNQTYGSNSILTFLKRYNIVLDDIRGLAMFNTLIGSMKALAIGFCFLLFFIDLSEKVTEKNFSTEQFFKALLRVFTAYMFISNADIIVQNLLDIGTAVGNTINEQIGGFAFFTNDASYRKTMLINGLKNLGALENIGYIASALIPWVIAMIGEVILQVILISRVLEISVMTIFSPIAISNIYRDGTSSSGVNYMKKMLALGIQISVILIINAATQSIISAVVGQNSGQIITNLLLANEELPLNPGADADFQSGLASGVIVYTEASIRTFLDTILGKGQMLKVLGIMLARIGLIWNSMPLCEEITGAK